MGSISTKYSESMDLSQTPEEVLEMILCYVPHRDVLLNCSRVCKLWNSIINEVSLWKLKCDKENIRVPAGFPFDYKRLCIKRPFGRNLIKNCDASDGMSSWRIVSSSGDGFRLEPEKCSGADPCSNIGRPDVHSCWATSYGWCIKSQEIDLVESGLTPDIMDKLKPEITFEDWTAARFDCGSVYKCTVRLMSATGKEIEKYEDTREEVQWGSCQWHKVRAMPVILGRITHTFSDYPPGVRTIQVEHGGKDTLFWAGFYGAKITGTAIYFNVTDRVISAWQNSVESQDQASQ